MYVLIEIELPNFPLPSLQPLPYPPPALRLISSYFMIIIVVYVSVCVREIRAHTVIYKHNLLSPLLLLEWFQVLRLFLE